MLKITVGRHALAAAVSVVMLASAFSGQAKNMSTKDVSPFDIIKNYSAETRVKNYTKLTKSLTVDDAMAIDAKFSELYGEATISRNGTKVWEVPNPNAHKGQAKHITITCGPEDNGFYIAVDSRGASEGNYKDKKQQANRQKAKTQKSNHAQSNQSTPRHQSSRKSRRLKPNEHD